MKEHISYEFEDKDLEIIANYLFKAPKNPCENCSSRDGCCTGCRLKLQYERDYFVPFKDIFENTDSELCNKIIQYKMYTEHIKQLEEQLSKIKCSKAKLCKKFPSKLVELIAINEVESESKDVDTK